MPTVFKFFWFLCAAFMAVNVIIWRGRFAVMVSRGVATKAETDRFIVWLGIWLVGGSIALGTIGLAAGWSSPFCAGVLAFDTWPRTLTSGLMIAGWASLLVYVWRGSGADFLGRVAPALRQGASYDKRYSPAIVRTYVTVLVLGSAIGGEVAFRAAPVPPNLACPANPVAG